MGKKIVSIIIFAAVLLSAFQAAFFVASAKTVDSDYYYVSASAGNDSNDGTKQHPFKTIAAARNKAHGGDTVYIDSGVYSEPMIFWQSNSSKNEPYNIVGLTDDVYISAYSPLAVDWQKGENNIYYAQIGKYDDIPHVLWQKDGKFKNMLEARWPNADADDVLNMNRAIMDEGSDNNYLFDSDLPNGDLDGATVYAWTGAVWDQYVAFSRVITEYKSGQSLKFDKIIPDEYNTENVYKPQKGDWYYLVNSLSLLDCEREYYYDKSSGRLYLMLPDGRKPDDNEIWIQTESRGIEFWESSYVNLKKINLIGGGIKIDPASHHITLDNVNVYYSNWFRDSDGYATMSKTYNNTHICGDYVTWKNSEIAYTMSNGILITGGNNVVENCNIHDVNLTGGYNSAITFDPGAHDNIIRRCNLSRSGRFLIYFSYSDQNDNGYGNTLIEYNDIHDCMYLTSDGGAIYTYHRNGDGVVIRNNWVHDTKRYGARGIYLDNNSSNFKVYRNVVWNIAEAGIVLNTDSTNNLICNNTVFDCGEGLQVWPKNPDSSMKGTRIINNILPTKADTVEGTLAPEKLNNIYSDSPKIDEKYIPLYDWEAVDGAAVISGVSDNYVGAAPDVGAYEYGGEYWVPGTNKSDLPEETTTNPTTKTTTEPTLTTQPTSITIPSESATKPQKKALYGDVNDDGKINMKDVLSMRKYIAGMTITINLENADCYYDNRINIKDVLWLRKYIAGQSVKLGK